MSNPTETVWTVRYSTREKLRGRKRRLRRKLREARDGFVFTEAMIGRRVGFWLSDGRPHAYPRSRRQTARLMKRYPPDPAPWIRMEIGRQDGSVVVFENELLQEAGRERR